MTKTMYEPLVSVTRGPIQESVHFGAAAVVDSSGNLLFSLGDAQGVTYLRSTSKPIQAIPFVEYGGVEKYGFTEEETAIMCASHHGTEDHVRVVQSMHQKAGLSLDQMMCGSHYPYDPASRERMILQEITPVAYHNNCSGKHTMMLAYAKLKGYPAVDYVLPEHPVQQDILTCMSEMCGIAKNRIEIGIDGCSVPVFGMPLYNAALGFARMADPRSLPDARANACRVLTQAMMHYPGMIAGPNSFDTDLLAAAHGKVFTKGGAEGFQGAGVLSDVSALNQAGIGIAIKISDGDSSGRARAAVTLEILRHLHALTESELGLLSAYDNHHPVTNWRKIEVGKLETLFTL
jgi:L-asparaginase II